MTAQSISIRPALEPVEYTCKAYICDDATHKMMEGAFKTANWTNSSISLGGIQEAVRRLAIEEAPDFLIIDLSECEDPLADVNALADVCSSGMTVLAIGKVNDVQLYRDLLNAGIQDYLVKPLPPETLNDALNYAAESLSQDANSENEDAAEHRFATFIGLRGGVGATTLATAVAYQVSANAKRKTALLDLDIYFGAAALSFDIEPGRGLCDAIENPTRVDSLFIERATVKQNEMLSILGAEAPLNTAGPSDVTALSHLENELYANFDFVAVDMPRNLIPTHGSLLANSTDVVIVADLSLTSARDTIRMLQVLKDYASKAKVHLVLNKTANVQCEMSKADFEQSIERKVDLVLPLDTKPMIDAAKKGESVLKAAPNAKISAGIKKLSKRLYSGSDAQQGDGILAKLHLDGLLKPRASKAANK